MLSRIPSYPLPPAQRTVLINKRHMRADDPSLLAVLIDVNPHFWVTRQQEHDNGAPSSPFLKVVSEVRTPTVQRGTHAYDAAKYARLRCIELRTHTVQRGTHACGASRYARLRCIAVRTPTVIGALRRILGDPSSRTRKIKRLLLPPFHRPRPQKAQNTVAHFARFARGLSHSLAQHQLYENKWFFSRHLYMLRANVRAIEGVYIGSKVDA